MVDEDSPIYIGVNLATSGEAYDDRVLDIASKDGYDIVVSRITTDHYKRVQNPPSQECATSSEQIDAPTVDDLVLFPGPHIYSTVGLCAPWTDINSHDINFAKISYQVLKHELAYAVYCGLSYVLIDCTKLVSYCANNAHNRYLLALLIEEFQSIKISLMFSFSYDSWEAWDKIRVLTDYPSNLSLALVCDKDINTRIIKTWKCEPISMLFFSHSILESDSKDYIHNILCELTVLKPFVVVNEDADHHHDEFSRNFVELLKFFLKQETTEYPDSIRFPLLPLSEPLTNEIYEVFHSDVTKYDLYYKAVLKALHKMKQCGTNQISIAVVGAGKGGLVESALRAARTCGMTISVLYAVEKHLGPIVSLQMRQRSETLWSVVRVVHSDMRFWVPDEPVNLLISELLGSFGDNELSPECLKPLETNSKVLAPNAFMIPQKYTSYIAPVFCPLLWQRSRESVHIGNVHFTVESGGAKLDVPKVVKLNQAQILSKPKPLWTFEHPGQNEIFRYVKTQFEVVEKSRVYGFAGFFETVLFEDVIISTLPGAQHFDQCVSWYPFLFFLSTPISISDISTMSFTIIRTCDNKKVWYEWFAEALNASASPVITGIHNRNGKSAYMPLDIS